MKYLISRFSMKLSGRTGFTDIVSGKYVKYWIDIYGQEFMAVSKFSFRVKIPQQTHG